MTRMSPQHQSSRKLLTTPNTSPEPESEPAVISALDPPGPIPPSTFYSAKPSAPDRRATELGSLSGLGSSHTIYHAPTTSHTPPPVFRSQPQLTSVPLVDDYPTADASRSSEPTDADLPQLIPDDNPYNIWTQATNSNWDEDWTRGAWPNLWGKDGYHTATGVSISGLTEFEEKNWWDKSVRTSNARPGPGILPPLLVERILEHPLLTVTVSVPEAPAHASSLQPTYQPPSSNDVYSAVPHPYAHYCRQLNSWTLLRWKSSRVLPVLREGVSYNLPDQERRFAKDCLTERYLEHRNKTHHFHVYEKAVLATQIVTPYVKGQWQAPEPKVRIDTGGDLESAAMEGVDYHVTPDPEELLDLYICCGCSTYVLASATPIAGIVPPEIMNAFAKDRAENPPPGVARPASVVAAFDLLLRILYNPIWAGDDRALRITGKTITRKIGWSSNVEALFRSLGYTISTDDSITPPNTDPSTPTGARNRTKLLRAWVEIQAWLVDYSKANAFELKAHMSAKASVKLESVREIFERGIGAHPDELHRGILSDQFREVSPREIWESLGMMSSSFAPDLLEFAYRAQVRCDPANTPVYFGHLCALVTHLETLPTPIEEMSNLVGLEQSRGRWKQEDLNRSIALLGFGSTNFLKVELHEVEDEFVATAWKDAMKRAWREDEKVAIERRAELRDAFRIVAESRESKFLRDLFDEADRVSDMTPERAYQTLEVPVDVGEDMLIAVYTMRIEDQPSQLEKMREALTVIADITDSSRLRQFLETGQDVGDPPPVSHPDWPRGLNQLGNTCYLNSLLQYFYTIKDLRDAISLSSFVQLEKLTDAEIQQHRVGGRMITRREIERSQQFVTALGCLFSDLACTEERAITPSIELAKLALVTSKDEEEEELEKKGAAQDGTNSSNSTDATLVDEPTAVPPLASKTYSPPPSTSVLGKRPRENSQNVSSTEVDNQTVTALESQDGFVMISKPLNPTSRTIVPLTPIDKLNRTIRQVKHTDAPSQDRMDEDVAMQDIANASNLVGSAVDEATVTAESPKPPPLPPRKKPVTESVMMFGKQHDVAEAMDNIMFQIETALLQFDGKAEASASVVKKLFYGKIRQQITVSKSLAGETHSIVHEKEDLFSHLPVNVSEEGYDIYDGLSGYFDDIVEYEGDRAKMEVSLVDLPPILQIQLQRVQFNRETLQPYKSHAFVRFGETLYVDRFLDTADPSKKARAKAIQTELTACRDRIHTLTQGQGAPFTEALSNSIAFLRSHDLLTLLDEDSTASDLFQAESILKQQMVDIRARAVSLKQELEALWQDDHDAEYELTSVFIHRGSSPTFGHYFFYARHLPENPDSWFKYNDSEVSIVTKDEVLADTTGSTANPYLLVYAWKGSNVMQTVQRSNQGKLQEIEI